MADQLVSKPKWPPWMHVHHAIEGYFDFMGRAPRAQFGWWFLFLIAGYVGTLWVDMAFIDQQQGADTVPSFVLFMTATLVPTLSLMIRRLHDAGYHGWVSLLVLLPYVGGLLLGYYFFQPTQPHPNKFGLRPSPFKSI